MASDYSNRIGSRNINVGVGSRPSPEDIDDLRRREQEHAKRTRAKPSTTFASVLADRERGEQRSDDEPGKDGKGEGLGDGDGKGDGSGDPEQQPKKPTPQGLRRRIRA